MLTIKNEGVILQKTDNEFENQAVLNPGCVEAHGIVHMYYRAVREGNFSTIGYCQLKDGKVVYRLDKPLLFPEYDYESHGLEDPRIVFLEGVYYLFYTAYDGKNALVAYATSKDLVTFKKHGILSPQMPYESALQFFSDLPLKEKYLAAYAESKKVGGAGVLVWEKDTFIFPKKINGQYALIHRVVPGIQVIYFDSFTELTSIEYWLKYLKEFRRFIILEPRPEDYMIGGGCPPIETPEGWLLIYHRVRYINNVRQYCAGAALLDLLDPTKLVGKLVEPLFVPGEEWERQGDVANVVFPTGTTQKDGRLTIYYGAADKVIAAKSVNMMELIKELKKV